MFKHVSGSPQFMFLGQCMRSNGSTDQNDPCVWIKIAASDPKFQVLRNTSSFLLTISNSSVTFVLQPSISLWLHESKEIFN